MIPKTGDKYDLSSSKSNDDNKVASGSGGKKVTSGRGSKKRGSRSGQVKKSKVASNKGATETVKPILENIMPEVHLAKK